MGVGPGGPSARPDNAGRPLRSPCGHRQIRWAAVTRPGNLTGTFCTALEMWFRNTAFRPTGFLGCLMPVSVSKSGAKDETYGTRLDHGMLLRSAGISTGSRLSPSGPQTKIINFPRTLHPKLWKGLGTRILPKLCSGADLSVGVDFSATVKADVTKSLETDLRQILDDLGLTGKFRLGY
jgi:hypothetical protein